MNAEMKKGKQQRKALQVKAGLRINTGEYKEIKLCHNL